MSLKELDAEKLESPVRKHASLVEADADVPGNDKSDAWVAMVPDAAATKSLMLAPCESGVHCGTVKLSVGLSGCERMQSAGVSPWCCCEKGPLLSLLLEENEDLRCCFCSHLTESGGENPPLTLQRGSIGPTDQSLLFRADPRGLEATQQTDPVLLDCVDTLLFLQEDALRTPAEKPSF